MHNSIITSLTQSLTSFLARWWRCWHDTRTLSGMLQNMRAVQTALARVEDETRVLAAEVVEKREQLAKLCRLVQIHKELDQAKDLFSVALQEQIHSQELQIALLLTAINKRDAVITELNQWATTDPLTGLQNERGASLGLQREGARLERSGYATMPLKRPTTVSVLVMDLDRFKEVNDTAGHTAGDAVLRIVAGHLVSSFRDEDIIFRSSTAGDEFVIVLLNAHKTDAVARARAFTNLVCRDTALRFGTGDQKIHVTVSIGIATGEIVVPCEESVVETLERRVKCLRKRADAAMYHGKAQRLPYGSIEIALDHEDE